MKLGDLLKEPLEVENEDVWENERTPTPVLVSRFDFTRWGCYFMKSMSSARTSRYETRVLSRGTTKLAIYT
jgi:hypothetical protein